ncbi:MAG: hypothetical protein KGQ46_07095 [Hyphomicrobiales bacterium]|nr:hypothetical protein [Hyphomicrobiales bacterium]MDE2114028.1 hypothetical protein [Hyphomicrobiales bacterium]
MDNSKPLLLASSARADKIADTSTFGTAFDKSDWEVAKPALSEALMSTPENAQKVPWFDARTGASGDFLQKTAKAGALGTGCRGFVALIDAYDGTHSIPGKACHTATGVWKVDEVLPDTFN